jgi:hypothetical protein
MNFSKPVALNSNTHRQLKFRPEGGFGFAAGDHAAPLGASEFFAAAKEYAIVFVSSGGDTPLPVVVLGLKDQENLFISPDGQWNARYVPLSIRSYPFTSIEADTSLQIVIDEAYAGFNEQDGIALFADGGEPAEALQGTLNLLRAQRHDINQTRRLGAELARLGLLTERSAQLQLAGGEQFKINGFSVVDEAKLNVLGDAELLKLARQGHLALITAHLLSISNLGLLATKLSAAAEPQKPRAPSKKGKAGAHAKN